MTNPYVIYSVVKLDIIRACVHKRYIHIIATLSGEKHFLSSITWKTHGIII